MVQIPQYTQQVGIEAPGRSIPNVDTTVDDSIGRGLASLGGAISNVAAAAQQRARAKDEFNAKVGFDTYQEKLSQALEEQARNAPADGSGLHDQLLTTRSKLAGDYLSTITNPELRAKYATVLNTSDAEHWSNIGANTEWKMSNQYSVTNIGKLKDRSEQGIAANPAGVDNYVKDMLDTVAKAPDLTPAQREELSQKIRTDGPKIAAEAIKTMDPEALQYIHTRADNDTSKPGLPTESQRIDFLTRRLAPNLPGVPEDKVKAAITKRGGDVSAALGDLADEAGVKEKDKPAFIEQGLSSMGPARLISGKGHSSGGNVSDAGAAAGGGSPAKLIAGFEGYRSSAYWDVNHYRVGYGSDTVTHADGTVEKVTRDTKITQEDANRDLQRRVAQTQGQIASQVGSAWGNLSDGAKAALTSVGYNYGTLPKSVLAAAQSGDAGAVAQAILGLSQDNGGINSKRRGMEARVAAGGALPGGRVQVADASGTGGLPKSDAVPDGVPGNGPTVAGEGFTAPAFSSLPPTDVMSLQRGGSDAFTKSQQAQLAQDTTDQILHVAGATDTAPGDYAAASKMVDAIKDAGVRKDVGALIDSHFTRWDKIQKDQADQQYKQISGQIDQMVTAGDTAGAYKVLKNASLSPEDYNRLQTRIAKGPVAFDDPQAQLEISALKLKDPTGFAGVDLPRVYGNRLTTDTIVKLQGEQGAIAKAAAGGDDKAATSLIETARAANPIIDDNLTAIGIDPNPKLKSGAWADNPGASKDAAHVNFIRGTVQRELELLQAKLGRPPLLSEINDTVASVMKTYPRFKPITGWFGNVKDADVSVTEVLQAFDDANVDPQSIAKILRAQNKPVNAQTLQQGLEDYQAGKQ